MTGEYEPSDSRTVTGAETGSGGRWSQRNPVEPQRTGVREGATRAGEQQRDETGYGGGNGQAGAGLLAQVREHMEVVGADGAHVGTVDEVEGDRIKLTRRDGAAGSHQGRHHYVSAALVAGVEGETVRLSATGAEASSLIGEA